jgi:hypothetical protein
MYIKNIDSISNDKKYKCKKQLAKWLQYEQHLPLLSEKEDFYYFARTHELEQALLKIPFWLKMYA